MAGDDDSAGSLTDSSVEEDTNWSRKSNVIVIRPHASAGYWLCCLVPLALCTHYLDPNRSQCPGSTTDDIIAVGAIGMCIESLCFFMYMFLETGLLLKLLISLVPGLLTICLYKCLLLQPWPLSIFCSAVTTFCYQNIYIRVLRGFPRSFSYGEAAVLVQGVVLFVLNVLLHLPRLFTESPVGEFATLNRIMLFSLFCLFVACLAMSVFKSLRQPIGFYSIILLLTMVVSFAPITYPKPIVLLLSYVLLDRRKWTLLGFYIILVAFTVCVVSWQMQHKGKASTRVRKIFHLLIVLVYIPGLLTQCAFLYIATGVALAVFTVVELWRLLSIPPFNQAFNVAFKRFCDEKDSGLLALTPFCLLIGCSMPLWMHPCPCAISNHSLLPLLAGILSIGFGDTAASVIGSTIGTIKWKNTQRTVEGSLAFVAFVLLAVYLFNVTGFITMSTFKWVVTAVATLITAAVEAHTDQIDNLVLPLIFYSIVNMAEIQDYAF